MLYLLDTNVVAIYLNQRSQLLRNKLEAIDPTDIAVCSVVKFELFYGEAIALFTSTESEVSGSL
ncbi:MAG: hypothetical protein ABWU13_14500 [Limnospira maxima]